MVGRNLAAHPKAKRWLLSRRQKAVSVHCQAEITGETEPRAGAHRSRNLLPYTSLLGEKTDEMEE
jgi:hypothetical protein